MVHSLYTPLGATDLRGSHITAYAAFETKQGLLQLPYPSHRLRKISLIFYDLYDKAGIRFWDTFQGTLRRGLDGEATVGAHIPQQHSSSY